MRLNRDRMRGTYSIADAEVLSRFDHETSQFWRAGRNHNIIVVNDAVHISETVRVSRYPTTANVKNLTDLSRSA